MIIQKASRFQSIGRQRAQHPEAGTVPDRCCMRAHRRQGEVVAQHGEDTGEQGTLPFGWQVHSGKEPKFGYVIPTQQVEGMQQEAGPQAREPACGDRAYHKKYYMVSISSI